MFADPSVRRDQKDAVNADGDSIGRAACLNLLEIGNWKYHFVHWFCSQDTMKSMSKFQVLSTCPSSKWSCVVRSGDCGSLLKRKKSMKDIRTV